MAKTIKYFASFQCYDPATKQTSEARYEFWAASQRHAQLVARMIYPDIIDRPGYDIRPMNSED